MGRRMHTATVDGGDPEGSVSEAVRAASCTRGKIALPNGTPCGTNEVCHKGACMACNAGVACTPADHCHLGETSCSTGVAVCSDTGVDATNGTVCGTNLVCSAGTCT